MRQCDERDREGTEGAKGAGQEKAEKSKVVKSTVELNEVRKEEVYGR